MNQGLDLTVAGGGMITKDLILPSICHLQRTGVADNISTRAPDTPPLKALGENEERADDRAQRPVPPGVPRLSGGSRTEAARLTILCDGGVVKILYGKRPHFEMS